MQPHHALLLTALCTVLGACSTPGDADAPSTQHDAAAQDVSAAQDAAVDGDVSDTGTDVGYRECGTGVCLMTEACWCKSPVVCCPIGTLCNLCPDADVAPGFDANQD